ncbi:RES family NAD+ phosphorylase [Gluconacetobacter aggeris]|uniref:RES family NAD+ phosphorylase n=1 Tax=Gluconacetobacter aggeris TaxID=1286186 RepID=A0A7W4NXY1_9PROT|nr:RES family NAD+ phosphorylase [Gluconacetobacter aggeris]MBB2170366.1 RES family NAD+ phosphorylase [Gluconacetobacter aggeris]
MTAEISPRYAGEARVCADCVGDPWLQKDMFTSGRDRRCAFCDRPGITWDVAELARRTDRVYRRVVGRYHDAEHWRRRREAQHPREIVETLLQCDTELADAVLSEMGGGDGANEPDEQYLITIPAASSHSEDWQGFCQSLESTSRFFNDQAARLLEDLLGSPPAEAVVTVGPGTEQPRLFRARLAVDPVEVAKMLADPAAQFAAPPPALRRAGRMNAAGIPVLYLACEEETALAELRPALGAEVVIAPLAPQRPLRLLDLSRLGDSKVAYFHPELALLEGRRRFLAEFGWQISRPVPPHQESIGYLPTQCVADYLANKASPRYDGVLYPSALRQRGRNIVLFAHALSVGADDPRFPLATKAVRLAGYHPEDPPEYVLCTGGAEQPGSSPSAATLLVLTEDLVVHSVSALAYTSAPTHVSKFDNPAAEVGDAATADLGLGL